MSAIVRRLSVPELSQQILEMAKTGVYRQSIFEALRPLATQQQIRKAIAHAKRFGLHSIANLRDAELGTYYQVDLTQYQTQRHLLHSPAHFGEDADLLQRVTVSQQTIAQILGVARGLAIGLGVASLACGSLGWGQVSLSLLSGAIGVAFVWGLQRSKVPPAS
jgi:hypothetical protein